MPEQPLVMENRTVNATFEVREAESTAPKLEGYATTFGVEYDMGAFRERVDREAFTKTLATEPDVRLLVDHQGQPLARTKSGTLTLSPDTTGLHMRAELDPSDPDVQRLMPKMRRGDLDQMSFAFRVPRGGDEWSDDHDLRTLREVNMAGGDVSVVTYPANPSTSVSLRSDDVRDAHLVLVQTMVTELRAGKPLSDAALARLSSVLDALTGEITPEPEPVTGRSLSLARAQAVALAFHRRTQTG
ncbi:MAG: hypothetical protein NVSMB4_03660 [Acidimicrobiales bacterium]